MTIMSSTDMSPTSLHPSILRLVVNSPPLLPLICVSIVHPANGYRRSPCPPRRWWSSPSATRHQFQFPDCRAHDLDVDLPIGEASFLMAHDAATGYLDVGGSRDGGDGAIVETYGVGGGGEGEEDDGIDGSNDGGNGNGNGGGGNKWTGVLASRLLSLYGKTQTGTAYDMLNHGARALDLRPKLYDNGTVGFHHGTLIDVPLRSITLGGILDDVVRWCNDNPTELVLLFHSELAHESGYAGLSRWVAMHAEGGGEGGGEGDEYSYYYAGIAAMRAVYGGRGVPYHPCESLSGLTVGEVMALADLSRTGRGGGYVLAVDRHDMYASFCGKANWVESQLVTCHSQYYHHDAGGKGGGISYTHCTDARGSGGRTKLDALRAYARACTNDDASDNANVLGPPSDPSYYPFNQVQGLWQVDAESVRIGLLRAQSNLLDDNRRSGVNGILARMAYDGEFDAVSVFAMDNVALNGNAMFSVLRNACGQSSSTTTTTASWACGQDLPFPNIGGRRALPLAWEVVLLAMSSTLALMALVMFVRAYRLRDTGPQGHRLVCNGHLI